MKISNFSMIIFETGGRYGLKAFILLLFLCYSLLGFSQQTVTGKVTDDKGEPVIGASIVIKNTTIGTISDFDGSYSLSNVSSGNILVFSYVGMKTVEIAVGAQTRIDITLEEESVGLEEVVVVGYGIQRKESVVGAITQIETESLIRSGVTNITNAITGKLSGVLTIQPSGEPGNNYSQIVIRGLSSWNGSEPLIMVDGVEREFRDLDPNEIKTISVLKDASATAIFGAKGANGVILVTTKRGLTGKPKMSFSGSAGVENIARVPKHVDAYTTMSMLNVAYMNGQMFSNLISDDILQEYRNPSTPLNAILYPDVNWYELMTNKIAPTSNANLNVSGGNKFVRYFGSIGHTYQSDFYKNTQEGVLDSRYWYHRLNYRANLDFDLTRTTLFSFNMGGDIGIKNQPVGFSWRHLYGAPTTMFPAYYPDWVLKEVPDPDYPDDTGRRLAQTVGSYHQNPYTGMASASFNRYLNSKLFTDIIFDQKLDFITKGLSAKGKASMNTYFRNNSLKASYAYPEYVLYPDRIGTSQNPWYRSGESSDVYVMPPINVSIGNLEGDYYRDLYFEASLNYNRNFGNHNTTAMILGNRQQNNRGTDFPFYYQGLVGRSTYSYKLKYLLEVNIGYTGSERFAPGNRYGFFPAGAIGYVLSEEEFFKAAVPWMNRLKFRYSDGLVGSDVAANRWLYISDYYIQAGCINEDKGANFTAQWEEARKKNLGVEIGLFDNLITTSIDVFEEQRSKMLLEPRTVTFIVGNEFKELNLGKFEKHGFEIEAEFNKTTARDFNYYVRGIFGWNENRVIFKDDLPYAPEYARSAGKPVDANLDGVALTGTGYFTSVDDIHNNPQPLDPLRTYMGDYKFLDFNVDGIIDKADKHVVPGSFYAPAVYSMSGGFGYKGFNFHILFQGNQGKYAKFDLQFEHEFTKGDYRVHQTSLDYWRPDNQDAGHATLHFAPLSIDNIAWAGGSGDQGYTMALPDHTWRDASYLRLKEIYASYSLKSDFLSNVVGISNILVYATGNNIFTWTKLIENDPEIIFDNTYRHGHYPVMRRFTLGLNFSF